MSVIAVSTKMVPRATVAIWRGSTYLHARYMGKSKIVRKYESCDLNKEEGQ